DCLLLVPSLDREPARAAADYCHRFSREGPEWRIVGLLTDEGARVEAGGWFPWDVRWLAVDDLGVKLSTEERADLVAHIIRNYAPELVCNAASRAASLAFERYGNSLSTVGHLISSSSRKECDPAVPDHVGDPNHAVGVAACPRATHIGGV